MPRQANDFVAWFLDGIQYVDHHCIGPFPHPDITLHGALSRLTPDPRVCFSHFPGDVQYYRLSLKER